MSFFYKEKNNESTMDLFNKRVIYKSELRKYSSDYSNIVNFSYGEKLLYGRVNRTFVPIQIEVPNISLKGFKSVAQPAQGIKFVVDAFEALALQFRRCALTGKIDAEDPYLSNLLVYKAYQSPNKIYKTYRGIYFSTLAANFKVDKLNVKNFDEFIYELSRLLKRPTQTVPFTQTAFIKSRRCPINVSGLAVQIADLDPVSDEEKINSFVNSKNWEFYVNACRSYGFMIDEDMPWRLVADIGSSAMIEYAVPYGVTKTDIILHSIYQSSHISYFARFKYDLLRLYNMAKEDTIIETEDCGSTTITTITTLVIPTSYTIEQIDRLYSDIYFLKLYFKIRFWEDESSYTEAEKEKLVNDCVQIYRSKGTNKALYVFEKIINKPFDYRGSMSYISKQIEAMSDAATE
jgi:hypothetical protein